MIDDLVLGRRSVPSLGRRRWGFERGPGLGGSCAGGEGDGVSGGEVWGWVRLVTAELPLV